MQKIVAKRQGKLILKLALTFGKKTSYQEDVYLRYIAKLQLVVANILFNFEKRIVSHKKSSIDLLNFKVGQNLKHRFF